MAPKKKIVKKVIKTVRKVVKPVSKALSAEVPPVAAAENAPTDNASAAPAPVVEPPAAVHTGVSPAPAKQLEEAKEAQVEGKSVPEVEKAITEEEKTITEEEKTTPMEMEESKTEEKLEEVPSKVDGVSPEKAEAKSGKKMVKKLRKVKKVIVRRIPKVKAPSKETTIAEDEVAAVSRNGGEPLEKSVVDGEEREAADAKEEARQRDGEEAVPEGDVVSGEISERRRRRMTEIFIGGLERSAGEEDLREVFGSVGEIVEVRLMMDAKSGKNKGYAFLRYATAAQARQAVAKFNKVEVCGKLCGASAVEGNDTIFIGNIDKKWKKEDVIKLLKEIGIEKIDTVSVVPDPQNANINRGFAFLELETNRDAQIAYKKLQMKDAFGIHKNIKVSWATSLHEPNDEDMQKVKSVYVEGIPLFWSEERIKKRFGRFGEIERVVLSRNMQSAKRKDFAFINYTTREAALSCIESFDKEASDNAPKGNIKVSLAKPMLKAKQKKGSSKPLNKEIPKERTKATQINVNASTSVIGRQSVKIERGNVFAERDSSTTAELLHVLRQQASWNKGQVGFASTGGSTANDLYGSHPEKRPYSTLGEPSHYTDPRSFPRPRLDTALLSAPSLPSSTTTTASLSYFQRASVKFGAGASYSSNSASLQGRYSTPYAGSHYGRLT